MKIYEGSFTQWHLYLLKQIRKDKKKIEKLDKISNNLKMATNEIIHSVR